MLRNGAELFGLRIDGALKRGSRTLARKEANDGDGYAVANQVVAIADVGRQRVIIEAPANGRLRVA